MTTRDEAIMICSIAACTPDLSERYADICEELGMPRYNDSCGLACKAWSICMYADQPDAEAEALLRTGWTP